MKFLISISILLISSCDVKKRNALNYSEDFGIYQFDTVEYILEKKGDLNKYLLDKNIYEYKIDESAIEKTSLKFNNESMNFIFIDSTSLLLNEKRLSIYKFQSKSTSLDGAEDHFISSSDGLVLIKSSTWENYTSFKGWAPSVIENLFIQDEVQDFKDALELNIETSNQ